MKKEIYNPQTIIFHMPLKYWVDWYYFYVNTYIIGSSKFIIQLQKEIKRH